MIGLAACVGRAFFFRPVGQLGGEIGRFIVAEQGWSPIEGCRLEAAGALTHKIEIVLLARAFHTSRVSV
jgi:hypothetical protein